MGDSSSGTMKLLISDSISLSTSSSSAEMNRPFLELFVEIAGKVFHTRLGTESSISATRRRGTEAGSSDGFPRPLPERVSDPVTCEGILHVSPPPTLCSNPLSISRCLSLALSRSNCAATNLLLEFESEYLSSSLFVVEEKIYFAADLTECIEKAEKEEKMEAEEESEPVLQVERGLLTTESTDLNE